MNEREQEKTLTRLLARGLRQHSEAGGVECPDAELLAAYHDRALEDAEVTRLDTHFSVCARCQQMLAALALSESELHAVGDDELVPAGEEELAARPAAMAEMHMAAAAPSAPAAPRAAAAAPTAILGPPGRIKPKRRFWSVRWLAPALAAAAAVALWIGLRPHLFVTQTPSPQEENKIASAPTDRVTTSETSAEPPKEIAQSAPMPSPAEALESHAQGKVEEAAGAPLKSPAAKPRTVPAPEQPRHEPGILTAETTRRQPADEKRVRRSGAAGIAAAPSVAISGGKERADQAQEIQKKEAEIAGTAAAKPGAAEAQKTVEVTQALDKGEAGKLTQKPAGVATMPAPAPPPPASKTEEAPQKAAKVQGGASAVAGGPTGAAQLRSSMVFPPARVLITTPSASVLWRVGFAGQIERSRDSGRTWLGLASNVAADLVAGSAPSETVCWAVGRAGTVLRTTDGEHWEKTASPTTADLIRVTAQDALNATVVAADRQRYATSDGGRTWRSSTN